MNFFRKLFSVYKPQLPLKTEVELSSRHLVHQQPTLLGRNQAKHNSQSSSLQSQFKSRSMAGEIQTKILHIHQLSQNQSSWTPDFGVLVGIIGRQKYYQNILSSCHVLKIGKSQQINSLQALRRKSLDSLVVFLSELSCQYDLEIIILAEQKSIFVVQSMGEVQKFLSEFQKILLDTFRDMPLHQCIDWMCLQIHKFDDRYFIQFRDRTSFLEYFRNSLQKLQISYQDTAQLQRLIKTIKLKDYLDFRQCKQSTISKILNLKHEIGRQIQKQKKHQEMKIINSLLSTCENQEDEVPIPEPVRKNSSMQADIEAAYFNKRVGQVKIVQTGINELRYSSDLFYFIEQQDNSSYSSNQEQKKLFKIYNRKQPKRINRSKSEHAFELSKQEDLDDQFFSKY